MRRLLESLRDQPSLVTLLQTNEEVNFRSVDFALDSDCVRY